MSLAAKRARRVRRRTFRRKLEVFATDQGLLVLPCEPTQALRQRVVEVVESWERAPPARDVTADLLRAINPATATGRDLDAIGAFVGVERLLPEGAIRALSLAYHMRHTPATT